MFGIWEIDTPVCHYWHCNWWNSTKLESTLNMSKIATTIPLTTSKLWGNIPPRYYESPLYSPVQSGKNKQIVEEVGVFELVANKDELMEEQIKELARTAEFYDEEVYEEYVYEKDEPIVETMEEVVTSNDITIGVKRSIDEVVENLM
jgi:hypothetical protein